MSFTEKQKTQLGRAPAKDHVRTRERRGRSFCYLEAWRAIEAANRIFGPDGWDRETLEMRCAASKQISGVLTAAYVAKVRVTVHTEGRTIVREGQGCGEGRGDTPFEAHDMGLKAAETDATKRALATFGRALGLGFYLGERPRETTKAKAANPDPAPDQSQDGSGASDANADAGTVSTLLSDHLAPDADWGSGDDPEDDGPAGGGSSIGLKRSTHAPALTQKGVASHERGAAAACYPSNFGPIEESEPPYIEKDAPCRDPAPGPDTERIDAAYPSVDAGIGETAEASSQLRVEIGRDPTRPSADPPSSAMLIPKERRVRNKEHLRYVASQPCLICDREPSDAHHLRFAQPTAMAKKVSDEFTVPLCRIHHRQLHRDSEERGWWEAHGIDPLEIADQLWNGN